MAEKDIEATLQFAQKLLSAAGDLTGYSRSRLYEHMEFREPGEESLEKMRETLVKCLREEAFGARGTLEGRWTQACGPYHGPPGFCSAGFGIGSRISTVVPAPGVL